MRKLKRVLSYVFVFAFFATMTFGVLMFGIAGIRCIIDLINRVEPDIIEFAGLILYMLIGGSFGLIWFIIDTDDGGE